MNGNPGKLVKTLATLQHNVSKIHKDIEAAVFEGQAAGGLLKISINGKGEAQDVVVNPALLQESPDMLQDVIVAALNDAQRKKEVYSKEKLKTVAGGLGALGFAVPGLG